MNTPHLLSDADLDQIGFGSKHQMVEASEARLRALLNRGVPAGKQSLPTKATPTAAHPSAVKARLETNAEARVDKIIRAVKTARASHNAAVNAIAEDVFGVGHGVAQATEHFAMTLDEMIATASVHLDAEIAKAAEVFELAMTNSGITTAVITEASMWYLEEKLPSWRAETLDRLREWLMDWPESIH